LGEGETSRVDQFANLELKMDLGTYEDSFLGRAAFVPDISTVCRVHILLYSIASNKLVYNSEKSKSF
jgi:hypothetical protein